MANAVDTSVHQRFSSRLALLLSVLGIAVGTGNIWRFPRIAAQNGGDEGAAAFLVVWILFLFLWSIPLIIAEYALGSQARAGTVGTFVKLVGEKFAWMGAFVGFVSTAIMFYYAVIAGWCAYYFIRMLTGPLPQSVDEARVIWDSFQGGFLPVVFHFLMILAGALAIWYGVRSIERVNKILIPTLLLIVIISVLRAVTLPGAEEGLAYLFHPQWAQLLRPRIWLEALTQNAWDTGAGWGLILTYAAYMQREHGVVKNAFITGVGNNTVSMLAAIMIFCTVFAILGAELSRSEVLDIMRDSGPASTGLTFIWMPQLYAKMAGGKALAILFFLGLTFAAFSSLISMIELATRTLVDWGLPRKKAIPAIATAGFLLGLPSAINLNFLGNQDFVWGVALMISGGFIAFAVIRYGAERLRKEMLAHSQDDWNPGRAWELLMRYVIPVEAIALLVWWMSLSATVYAPHEWYNPLNPYSVATCLVQWGTVLAIFYYLNDWMATRLKGLLSAPQ